MKNIFSSRPLNPQLLISLLTSLVCAVSLEAKVHETHVKESKDSSTSHSKEKECRECDFVITAKDIGCDGAVLCKSGYYCLCEDVVFNPKQCKNAAIRISASNVTLDLRGRTLSQKSKNVLPVDGIVVDPGLTNISIKNGTVRDFSDAGIRVGAVSTTSTVPLVSELSIRDIRSFNNGLSTTVVNPGFSTGDGIGGAVILNAQDVTISDSVFNENFLDGIWAFNMTKFTMENCHCDDNLSANLAALNAQATYGAAVTGHSADVLIKKCTFNRNMSAGVGFGFNSGFAAQNGQTTNLVFDSCQFNGTNTTVSDHDIAFFFGEHGGISSGGVTMFNATNVTFNNCEAHGISLTLSTAMTSTFPPLNGPTTDTRGFFIEFCKNVNVINCSSSGLKFQNNSDVGVREFTESFNIFFSNKVFLSNCSASGNTNGYASVPTEANPSLFVVEGFDISSSENIMVEDCFSSGHTQAAVSLSALAGEFSIAAGFNAHFFSCGSCGPVVFRRCVATGNVDTTVNTTNPLTLGGTASGFSTREPQFAGTPTGPNSGPYVFESCIAENNTNGSGTGSGFDIFNLVDSEIINCVANSNNIGINVTDFGIGASNDNIFRGNVVSANTAYGIRDNKPLNSTPKNNAYYSNQAKNNGRTPATTNYSGAGIFPTASCNTGFCSAPGANLTPVLFWNLPQAPCATNSNCVASTSLDNLSIVN